MPNSGIQTAPSGERRIPESVRADGSLRKEIRIRPGYRPPEDVEVYKNRTAEAWKNRGKEGVPGADGLKADDTAGGIPKGKNAKRREARKKAKITENIVNDSVNNEGDVNGSSSISPEKELFSELGISSTKDGAGIGKLQSNSAAPSVEECPDPLLEKEKQARNIKKKLRQARDLKEKKESGESLLPEQFAKVIKIQELIRQLDALGFDSDGIRKPDATR